MEEEEQEKLMEMVSLLSSSSSSLEMRRRRLQVLVHLVFLLLRSLLRMRARAKMIVKGGVCTYRV